MSSLFSTSASSLSGFDVVVIMCFVLVLLMMVIYTIFVLSTKTKRTEDNLTDYVNNSLSSNKFIIDTLENISNKLGIGTNNTKYLAKKSNNLLPSVNSLPVDNINNDLQPSSKFIARANPNRQNNQTNQRNANNNANNVAINKGSVARNYETLPNITMPEIVNSSSVDVTNVNNNTGRVAERNIPQNSNNNAPIKEYSYSSVQHIYAEPVYANTVDTLNEENVPQNVNTKENIFNQANLNPHINPNLATKKPNVHNQDSIDIEEQEHVYNPFGKLAGKVARAGEPKLITRNNKYKDDYSDLYEDDYESDYNNNEYKHNYSQAKPVVNINKPMQNNNYNEESYNENDYYEDDYYAEDYDDYNEDFNNKPSLPKKQAVAKPTNRVNPQGNTNKYAKSYSNEMYEDEDEDEDYNNQDYGYNEDDYLDDNYADDYKQDDYNSVNASNNNVVAYPQPLSRNNASRNVSKNVSGRTLSRRNTESNANNRSVNRRPNQINNRPKIQPTRQLANKIPTRTGGVVTNTTNRAPANIAGKTNRLSANNARLSNTRNKR